MNASRVFRWSTAIGVWVMVAGAVTALAQGTAPSRPDLSGQWVLNRDLSTDPRGLEEGRSGRGPAGDPEGRGRRGGGMPGRFGGGMRGGSPGGFGPGAGGDERTMREQMEEAQQIMRDAPASMVVTYHEPKLTIVADDGRIRTLYADKHKVKTANGNAEVEARWDGNRLVAETKFGSIKVLETYAVAESGDQLVTTAKMDVPGGGRGGRPNLELRRVYDRVSSGDAPVK
jgi:hypothetical protein